MRGNAQTLGAAAVLSCVFLHCSDSDEKTCTLSACRDPLRVNVDMTEIGEPTWVEAGTVDDRATFQCPPPPEPQWSVACDPVEQTVGDVHIRIELSTLERPLMHIDFRDKDSQSGPEEVGLVVGADDTTLLSESFMPEYGMGYEPNGPGCGVCYHPVEYDRTVSLPSD